MMNCAPLPNVAGLGLKAVSISFFQSIYFFIINGNDGRADYKCLNRIHMYETNGMG